MIPALPSVPSAVERAEDTIDGLHSRYKALKLARRQLEEDIRETIAEIEKVSRTPARPVWHCRRCGNEWRGYVINRPPVACPRCHNANWQYDAIKAGARTPESPPNPKWGSKRGTRTPDPSPERVIPEAPPPMHTGTKAKLPRPSELVDPLELTPPPRIADLISSEEGPRLVPPPSVRFGEEDDESAPITEMENDGRLQDDQKPD